MASQRILKFFLWAFSLPHITVSLVLEMATPKGISSDLDNCVMVAKQYGHCIPQTFIDALIFTEDHRNELHPGIDIIAMIRSLLVLLTSRHLQGASTIEQQYLRVISKRYERTICRKIREQLLAIMLLRRITKQEIASSYLAIAFYGHNSIGLDGLKNQFGTDLTKVRFGDAVHILAQLKYPRPSNPDEIWKTKIDSRIKALYSCKMNANQSLKPVRPEVADIIVN